MRPPGGLSTASWAHAAGDEALEELAELLRDNLRESDALARVGGDEFCVLLTGKSAADTKEPVERLGRILERRNRESDQPFDLSCSIGAARYDPRRHRSMASLIEEADAGMYEVKRTRGARRYA